MLAVQALVLFNSLERGVQRHWEQRGEMGATSYEGPHACLLQNYSSQQIKYEPVQTPRSQASPLCDSPSQTGSTLMGGGGKELKMDHLGSAHQGKLPHKGIGIGKDSHLSNRSCSKQL